MIIKIWRYVSQLKGTVGGAAAQARGFDVALGCSCYILDIPAPQIAREAFDTAERVGDYATADSPTDAPQRILDRYSDNLLSDDLAGQVRELAVHAGAAGLENVWHFTWSHRPDESVDLEIMQKERQTIRRILGLQNSPGIGANHGDEDHEHGHDLSVSIDIRTGKPIILGEYWWKEAAQIACAVCEYEHGLQPEPNRRYVADSTGVYHTISDTRIAETDGTFVRGKNGKADHRLIKEIQKEHAKIFDDNKGPEDGISGAEWSLAKAVEVLAAPRIKEAKSWADVHAKLARVGLRYNKVGNTGVIEAVQYRDTQDDRITFIDDDEDQDPINKKKFKIKAGAAYSNAALGKLEGRFKENYVPPLSDLVIPKFVMPRYDKDEDEAKAVSKAERGRLKHEAKDLDKHLKKDNRERQTEIGKVRHGRLHNEQIARRAAVSEIEQELARDFAISIGARPKRRTPLKRKTDRSGAKILKARYFRSVVWSGFRSRVVQKGEEAEAELKARYKIIKNLGRAEYWEGQRLAFVETQNLIAIRSTTRQAKIDALRLAKAKLSSVRIFGRQDAIADTVFVAAELGLILEDTQKVQGDQHLEHVSENPYRSLLARNKIWSRTKCKLHALMFDKQTDRRKRRLQADQFSPQRLSGYERLNGAEVESERQIYGGTTQLVEAYQNLNTIDRSELLLASSRIQRGSYRYLDDPVLLQKFIETPQHLLIPEMQHRLEAIERVQREQRRWMCAAMLTGRIEIKNDALEAVSPDDNWAVDFYQKQKFDPTFKRLMMVSRLRPDRFQFNLDRPPEINAWNEARSADEKNMASFIAEELHLRTRTNRQVSSSGAAERDRIFAMIPEDAQALRDTPGSFLAEYGSRTFRKPKETDAQWAKRRALIRKNNRQWQR